MKENFTNKSENAIQQRVEKDYLGVKLPIAEDRSGAPNSEGFKDYVEDAFSRDMERIIATAWALDEPILIEGGTSLGKTRTVMKMCAELGYEVFYQNLNNHTDPADLMGKYTPNPEQSTESDPKYVFADGSVTKALRQEDGKIKVLILDEYNAAHPGVIIRLHEVLDAYKTSGTVVLTEDGNETIAINQDALKIIAITNPAGGGYSDREPLDPAQIRRWTYHKLPDELPQETFRTGVLALAGLGEKRTDINELREKRTQSNPTALPVESLRELPGMAELVPQYIAFHEAAKGLLKEKRIANNQRQKFSFDDREEPRRVFSYIGRFYSGDLAKDMKDALQYFYAGKILDAGDKKALEEMIRKVHYTPKVNPERQKLGATNPDNPFAALSQLRVKDRAKEGRKAYGSKLREVLKAGIKVRAHKELINDLAGFVSDDDMVRSAIDATVLPEIPFELDELKERMNDSETLILRAKDDAGVVNKIMNSITLSTEDFEWKIITVIS